MAIIKYEGKIWGIPAVKYEFKGPDYEKASSIDSLLEVLEWDRVSVSGINADQTCQKLYYKRWTAEEQEILYLNRPKERIAEIQILIADSSEPLFSNPIQNNIKLDRFLEAKLLGKIFPFI